MARDIEEFLRKAAERRRQQQAGKQGQGGAKPKPSMQPRRQSRPVRPAAPRVIELSADDIVEAEPVRADRLVKPQPRGSSVESNVRSQINTDKIAEHAESLGSLKAKTDDDVDEVKRKFDRGASKFTSKHATRDNTDDDIVGGDISEVASNLIEMLRDPQSARQAILVSEILRRPNFDD